MKRTPVTEDDRELVRRAIETADRLYVQDIHEVASALRMQSGEVFAGIHIEAQVGFADVCGEVAAICHAVAHGHRDLESIVAVYRDSTGEHCILPPCGRCREVISDFNLDCWVIVGTLAAPFKVRVSDLLPLKE